MNAAIQATLPPVERFRFRRTSAKTTIEQGDVDEGKADVDTSASPLAGVATSLTPDYARAVVRVRFAPSPTGSLHMGSALTAVANRHFADEHDGHFILRIDDTDEARTEAEAERGSSTTWTWLGHRVGRGPGAPEPAGRALRRGRRADARDRRGRARGRRRGALPRRAAPDARPRRRAAHVPARLGRGRRRPRDHARHPRHRPPGQRGAPCGPDAGARRRAARVHPPRPPPRPGRDEALEAPRRGVAGRPARARDSGRGGARLPGGARAAEARRPLRRAAAAPPRRRRARRALRRGARRAGRRSGRVRARACAVRAISPRRGRWRSSSPQRRRPRRRSRPTRSRRFAELRAAAPDTLDLAGADELLGALREGGADLRALRLALTGEPRGPELRAVIAALPRDEALARVAATS